MTRTITPTHVLLNQITLAANASSVTFSSIPQNYGDIVVKGIIYGTSGANIEWRLNGDTGNASRVFMYGSGTSKASAAGSSNIWSFLSGTNGTVHIGHIMDYSATDKHKTALIRTDFGGFDGTTWANVGRWASTNAVTSLLLVPSAGSFTVGTTLSLYGVVA